MAQFLKIFLGWGDGLVGKVGKLSNPQNSHKKATLVESQCEDVETVQYLAGQPSLCGECQASERVYLGEGRQTDSDKADSTAEGQCLKLRSRLHMHTHTYVHTHTHEHRHMRIHTVRPPLKAGEGTRVPIPLCSVLWPCGLGLGLSSSRPRQPRPDMAGTFPHASWPRNRRPPFPDMGVAW